MVLKIQAIGLKKTKKKNVASGDHNQLLGDKVMRLCDVAI